MKPRRIRPRAEAPGARFEPRTVYDGTLLLGAVMPSVAGFLARDAAGKPLGGFATMKEATRAVIDAARRPDGDAAK